MEIKAICLCKPNFKITAPELLFDLFSTFISGKLCTCLFSPLKITFIYSEHICALLFTAKHLWYMCL